jgi:protein SCO1
LKATFALIFFITAFASTAWAYDPKKVEVTGHELPAQLEKVAVKEHLGEKLDLSLAFVSDEGEQVTLGQYFKKDRPVLMAMVYYTCPALCNYHLNALTEAMKKLKWTAGEEFEVVAVSMNHRETPDVAAKKKANYLREYGRPEGARGWHFLTGREANVKALADQLGFGFTWLPEKEQYAHASVAYVVTPGGKLSRYLYGLNVEEQTLRLSLLEASNGKIGSIIEQVLMFCFQFDPQKSKYTLYAWNLVRIGALMMVLLLAIFLVPVWLRERNSTPRT